VSSENDGEEDDLLLVGCKYAFGCRLLLVFVLIFTLPLVVVELETWGLL
jgi:hypothetical protein